MISYRKVILQLFLPTDDQTDQAWYPKEKIKSAKRKLKGDNPAEIMR